MTRRLLFLIGCLSVCNFMCAQIMKDSTVQVVAYWNLGDKYKYRHATEEYTVEGNDTIWGDTSEELFTMEVVDSTENGYILEYRCLEETHNMQDKEGQALIEALLEKYRGVPYRFSTDAHGRFQDIVNWEQIQVFVDSITSDLFAGLQDYIKKDLGKENLDSIPAEELQQMNAIINHICQSMKNKGMMLSGMDYIIEPLYYHGSRLRLDNEYTGKQDFTSPWVAGDIVPGDVTFSVYKVDNETSWTTFHRTIRYDAGLLGASFLKYMMQVLPPEEAKQVTPEQIPFLMAETFLDLDVHLNTGWPGATYYKRTVQVGDKQKINTWFLDMVFDE